MTDDSRLKSWADSQRNAIAAHPPSDHIDVDTLSRHASGQLSPPVARVVSEHLLVCEDGRCVEFVRSLGAEVDPPSAPHDDEAPRSSGGTHQRTFQSREIVWSTFASMSRELDIPIDDLVNHAMAAYARVRGYSVPPEPMTTQGRHDPLEETHDAPAITALDRSYKPSSSPPGYDEDDLARTAGHLMMASPAAGRSPLSDLTESRTTPRVNVPFASPSSRSVTSAPSGPRLPPPPARSPGARMAPGLRPAVGNAGPPPLPPRVMPPSGQRAPDAPRSSSPPSSSSAKHLVLSYRGQPHSVEKERFLLGRSKTQADLRLDDPNVSRQHAVIERVGAAWYIVDLGSTNGVHVAGERVARRALSDGDVIVITSHEIYCSLR